MSICGIDSITYGVNDLGEGKRFFSDWGLSCNESGNSVGSTDHISLRTANGAEVILRHHTDPMLPAGIEQGPTLREVVWGVTTPEALANLKNRLGMYTRIDKDEPDAIRFTDPGGLAVSLRISQTKEPELTGAPVNRAGAIERIDTPAPIYQQARPLSIGHIVLFTDQLEALSAFYREALGFVLSDVYPNRGVFLRCNAQGGHHNLFLLQLPTGKVGLNHVAFVVRDIHEVFGGGLQMSRCGWETEIGPGRHPVSSAYFWYFKNPCGGSAEYYADEDYLTAAWQPRELQASPENFAEWAVSKGFDAATRRPRPENS